MQTYLRETISLINVSIIFISYLLIDNFGYIPVLACMLFMYPCHWLNYYIQKKNCPKEIVVPIDVSILMTSNICPRCTDSQKYLYAWFWISLLSVWNESAAL